MVTNCNHMPIFSLVKTSTNIKLIGIGTLVLVKIAFEIFRKLKPALFYETFC